MTNNPTPPPIPSPPMPAARSAAPRSRSLLQDAGLVFVILLLGLLLTGYGYYDSAPGAANTFLNGRNLIDGIAKPMSNYAIMAAGMTIVIVSGGIDISVASIQALAGLTAAWVIQRFSPETSIALQLPAALGAALGVGLICGAVNGALVTTLRLHPFIVTLGTLSIFRGLANVIPFGNKTLTIDGPVMTLFNWQVFGLQFLPLLVILRHHRGYIRVPVALGDGPRDVRRRRQRAGGAVQRHQRVAGENPRLHDQRPARGPYRLGVARAVRVSQHQHRAG